MSFSAVPDPCPYPCIATFLVPACVQLHAIGLSVSGFSCSRSRISTETRGFATLFPWAFAMSCRFIFWAYSGIFLPQFARFIFLHGFVHFALAAPCSGMLFRWLERSVDESQSYLPTLQAGYYSNALAQLVQSLELHSSESFQSDSATATISYCRPAQCTWSRSCTPGTDKSPAPQSLPIHSTSNLSL